MSEEAPADLQQLVNAIKQNTTWSGQTTRELRDKVDEGAKQVAKLSQALETAGAGLEGRLARLTAALEASGARAESLRRAMWLLIGVLALAILAEVGLGWMNRH